MPKTITESSKTSASSRVGDDRRSDDGSLFECHILIKGSHIRKPKDQHKKRGTKPKSLIEFRNHTEAKIAAFQREITLLTADNVGNKNAEEIFKLKKNINARKHRLAAKEKAEE